MSAGQFDPRSFFRVAQALSGPGQTEENLRTAISRAYYACFHVARLGLERGGRWQAGQMNAHQAVISELRRRNRRHLAARLDALRQLREYADYALDRPVSDDHCHEAMRAAAELLQLLDTF